MAIANHEHIEAVKPHRARKSTKGDTEVGAGLIGEKTVKVCGSRRESKGRVKYDHLILCRSHKRSNIFKKCGIEKNKNNLSVSYSHYSF